MSSYQKTIIQVLACSPEEARGVEAYLRLEFGTLDALSEETFDAKSLEAWGAVRADRKAAEQLAESFGL